MTTIWLRSVSVFGQGLLGWEHASSIFLDCSSYNPEVMPTIESRFLSPNNKRRTSPHMHMAILAAEHALATANVDGSSVDLVFASSEPDLDIAEGNLLALAKDTKELSPQKFQNVILNAAAGHLGIFMKNTAASTTMSGCNNAFAVGLLETYTTLLQSEKDALFVVYDAASEMPYSPKGRSFFSTGMLLTKARPENALAGLNISLSLPSKTTVLTEPRLEHVRRHTPAAACLPLLVALARNQTCPVELDYTEERALVVNLCF
jgi:hypothetical protein